MKPAPLTAEHYRILRAAADGRLVFGGSGRWVIAGESHPDRKCRERLKARGLLAPGRKPDGRTDWNSLVATPKGLTALAAATLDALRADVVRDDDR